MIIRTLAEDTMTLTDEVGFFLAKHLKKPKEAAKITAEVFKLLQRKSKLKFLSKVWEEFVASANNWAEIEGVQEGRLKLKPEPLKEFKKRIQSCKKRGLPKPQRAKVAVH